LIAEPGPLRTVLFDLDGTLADTAPELAHALNRVLEEQGAPPLPFAQIRPIASHGARGLIRLGFGLEPGHAGFESLRRRLLEVYQDRLGQDTHLFPGIPELLEALEQRGLNWGVVTNKPAWLTDPLMDTLGLSGRAACVVSGDTLPERKPHPAPLWHACRQVGSLPDECLYVGDARRDVEAGREAGVRTLVALYGYLGVEDAPERWDADGMVEQPSQILEWIEQRPKGSPA
jgi:N-acetyl-D-muramate 6-phosphate phosphatase